MYGQERDEQCCEIGKGSTAATPFFNNAPGVSVSDPVWRQAARAEVARSELAFFIMILWDLLKCYDYIDHKLLLHEAGKCLFP